MRPNTPSPTPVTYPSVDQTDSHDLRALLAYWQNLRAGRDMPDSDDIDPASIDLLLPHIALIDVAHQPLRFHVGFTGHALCLANDSDMTGYQGIAKAAADIAILSLVATHGQPCAGKDSFYSPAFRQPITQGTELVEITRDWIALPLGGIAGASATPKPIIPRRIIMGQKWKARHRLLM